MHNGKTMSKLPKAVTTITPLSLLLTSICFVTFPFLGFALGILYQKSFEPHIYYITESSNSRLVKKDYVQEVIERCGDLPSERDLGISRSSPSALVSVSGPLWSPDCRNVAWTQSLFPGMDAGTSNARAGLWVYNDASKNSSLVISAGSFQETPVLRGWKSNREIWFTMNGSDYTYDIATKITRQTTL
jgi:hypothetical protein